MGLCDSSASNNRDFVIVQLVIIGSNGIVTVELVMKGSGRTVYQLSW